MCTYFVIYIQYDFTQSYLSEFINVIVCRDLFTDTVTPEGNTLRLYYNNTGAIRCVLYVLFIIKFYSAQRPWLRPIRLTRVISSSKFNHLSRTTYILV